MEVNECTIGSFSVIGKEGTTNDGENFIQGLWTEANKHFEEVKKLAKQDDIYLLEKLLS